jgi:hypothetical protein
MLAWICYCSVPLPTRTRLIYRLTVGSVQDCSSTSRWRKSITTGSSAGSGWRTSADCREAAHPTRRAGSASCSFAHIGNRRRDSRDPERPQSSGGRLRRSLRGLRKIGGHRSRHHAGQAAVVCGNQAGAAQRWAAGYRVHTARHGQSRLQPERLYLDGDEARARIPIVSYISVEG